ncbi:flagellar biosynthesis protein FlhF [Siminovitchia sp. 179-K 8D1 HS]|uniref:flagellar biosynthesis protein FlhF n=1 Tax=Siminovitchia sp. 179-K 8D1 HS TaxID=3142385 RepID=UPI0039A0AED6
MKVEKIVAASMPEAMNRVKKELGEDAVILSSKVLWTKGIMGFFKKKQFEVIAALDQKKEKFAVDPRHHTQTHLPAQSDAVLKELETLKKIVEKGHYGPDPKLEIYPPVIQKNLFTLMNQELDKTLVLTMGDRLLNMWRKTEKEPDEKEMALAAQSLLCSKLKNLGFSGSALQKKFIAFVGPTGVGKTTTLAKLAACAMLEQKKKIGFITMDTYRIAAIEQLKTYAKLLDVPVEVVYDANDFREAAEKFDSHDHVFIDTAGRNYRDAKFVSELNGILSQERDLDIFLVLAASMKERDVDLIMNQFQHLRVQKFIFTKVDETDVYGPMINMMLKYNLASAYITDGQEVPDDLIVAAPELFGNYIFGEQNI